MCERCADYDFAMSEIWRPCYQPSQAQQERARARRRSYNDDDFGSAQTIASLRTIVQQQQRRCMTQQRTIEALRLTHQTPAGTSIPYDAPTEE